jgi:hypothetical protein
MNKNLHEPIYIYIYSIYIEEVSTSSLGTALYSNSVRLRGGRGAAYFSMVSSGNPVEITTRVLVQ